MCPTNVGMHPVFSLSGLIRQQGAFLLQPLGGQEEPVCQLGVAQGLQALQGTGNAQGIDPVLHHKGHGYCGNSRVHFSFGNAITGLENVEQALVLEQWELGPVPTDFLDNTVPEFWGLGGQKGLAGSTLVQGNDVAPFPGQAQGVPGFGHVGADARMAQQYGQDHGFVELVGQPVHLLAEDFPGGIVDGYGGRHQEYPGAQPVAGRLADCSIQPAYWRCRR